MNNVQNELEQLILVREFNASRETVFNAFSEADALNAWWGPAESKTTVISLDFRVGGIFHFQMQMNGQPTYGRFLFKKIKPYDALEFTNAFADEQARVVKAPFPMALPLEILYRLTFEESKGNTIVKVTAEPINAAEDEIATFRSINADVQRGFGATFDKLGKYLNELIASSN